MADPAHQSLGIGHPAPHRHRVPAWQLALALLVAPGAWLLQLLVGFAAPSYLCFPDFPRPADVAAPGWLGGLLFAANVLALVASAAALLAGWRFVSRTASENEQAGRLIDAGEGRTRFLATWALVISGLFLVAILFNTINLALVSSCLR